CRSPRDHVPPCGELETERSQAVVQARVANRGRAHVHAAATGAQVERAADDCHLSLLHGEEANQPLPRSVSLTATDALRLAEAEAASGTLSLARRGSSVGRAHG